MVAVPDDKGPQESWVRSLTGLGVSLADELRKCGWERRDSSPEEVEQEQRRSFISALPQRFKFLAKKISLWPKEITARIYLTCKSKCWGAFHLQCEKPEHSHCRKIVSYSGLCQISYPESTSWRTVRGSGVRHFCTVVLRQCPADDPPPDPRSCDPPYPSPHVLQMWCTER